MLFIVNRTQKTVIISDLNLPLGPRQAVDLDQRVGREKAERSKDLIRLIHDKVIEVKIKDNQSALIPTPEVQAVVSQPAQTIDIDKLRQDITKEVIASFKEVANDIKEHVSQNKSVTVVQGTKEEINTQNDDILLADGVLANIHAKAMDKNLKGVQGSFDLSQKNSQENIQNNVSELEGLI
jgi:predicted lipid-binding transport protein (Tim44 family)